MSSSKRSEQLEKYLKREINKVIYREINDPRIKFVTITKIQVSSGLKYAKVFVSIFNNKSGFTQAKFTDAMRNVDDGGVGQAADNSAFHGSNVVVAQSPIAGKCNNSHVSKILIPLKITN